MKMLRLWVLLGYLVWASGVLPAQAQAKDYLHAEGSQLVDSSGNKVILTGINWFGMETESYAPHGLWARNLDSILDQIVELGFNTIRLPYSNQLFDPTSQPNSINYEVNPDLKGLTGLEVLDKVISGAGERGLKVILDRHRPDSHSQSELWYTSDYDEARWIQDWEMLAKRYADDDTVIGMDLHNEPHGRATWGSDNPATDWRLAAERAGNAILKINPNLLIIVQGVEQYQGDWYWWGGNLLGAREQAVRLDIPAQLVYSTHVYGPGVYPQPWFSDPSFPNNLPEIWNRHWGYLSSEHIAPVIVGEFGGRSVGDDKEGIWQRALVSYLREGDLSYFYWTLNPNSGDTGGLLLDDWKSVNTGKEALLSGFQFPLIGIEQGSSSPATSQTPQPATQVATAKAATQPSSTALKTTPVSGTLKVIYRTANPADLAINSKPEFILVNTGFSTVALDRLELRYWLGADSEQPYVFHCDWAKVGCGSVTGKFSTSEAGRPYLSLRFGSEAGTLFAKQNTGEIKLRFNREDWAEFHQEAHYSFIPASEFIDWDHVTAYIDGKLIWGIEPGPDATRIPSISRTGTEAPLPTGVPERLVKSTPGASGATTPAQPAQNQVSATVDAADSTGNGTRMPTALGLVIGLGLGSLVFGAAWLVARTMRD